ncbi:hypothetical protein J2Z43_002467 [Clostridioides mangenotii]|uniref:Uncharacterized protein n=1 Tax=Metaclostridioides mangenotii TaxID=1540 RepID=A0ABS4EDP4_9FIRM|nr:hypothetical protein [Clostridioides mangenotii]
MSKESDNLMPYVIFIRYGATIDNIGTKKTLQKA